MDLSVILQLFTNMDAFLVNLASNYGMMIYVVMFLIFYLETGVFVFSFLPGDSLLFVAGTVAAAGTTSPFGLMLAVIIGAIVGNTQAYSFGRWFGQKIYTKNFLFLKQDKLMRAKVFYDKHGGKTVFLGRTRIRSNSPFPSIWGKRSNPRKKISAREKAIITTLKLMSTWEKDKPATE